MINNITFVDKNKNGKTKQQIALLDNDINIINYIINGCNFFL